ncbi:MAG: hypothetical protein FWB73_03025 [Treponema sp.]|nr:hypothetical protein [Treponema sp.]
MYEKYFSQFLHMLLFAVLLYAILCLFPGCTTNARALVSDIGNGAAEYRAVQTEQRAGEVELAVTGARIEAGLGELERSISASQRTEQEIGNVIQRVRARELDPAFVEEWRNRGTETKSGG